MKCEKIEKQSKIWLWNGIVWGGGSGLFSQWVSCCGQVVERQEGQLIDPVRTRMWPGQPDDRRVRDASRWSTRLPVLRLECNLRCKLLVFRHCHPLVFSPSCREPPKRARCSTTEFGYCAPCFVFVWVFLWICWCWLRSSISSFKPSAGLVLARSLPGRRCALAGVHCRQFVVSGRAAQWRRAVPCGCGMETRTHALTHAWTLPAV